MHGKAAIGLLLVSAVWAAPCGAREPKEEGGYWALFENGQEVTGERIRDWHHRDRRASLSGRRLFEPGNPVRILCHTARRPGGSGPRIFLANGDVLPGRVTGFLPAEPARNLPARLLVSPAAPLSIGRDPGNDEEPPRGEAVHVRSDSVARVVFGRGRPRPLGGGAVFLADGGAHAVSSVRWTPKGLKALAEDRIVSAAFRDLAEVHVPKIDRLAALLADTRSAQGDPKGRIGRMETEEGAVLTYVLAARRSRAGRLRGHGEMFHWVQPTWSFTAIRVPESSVCLRSYRAQRLVPLSLLEARTLEERSFTGFLWPWRRNRSVRGKVLRCGSYFSGLGLGTHSYSAVAFSLPPGARSFSCFVGLDRSVGPGGCARCAVRRDEPAGKVLWQSGFLTGTGRPLRVANVPISGAKRLVLVTDFAHDGRPAGADPGDIRDEVNWLMPMVRVDPAALGMTAEVLGWTVPALRGWTVQQKDLSHLRPTVVVRRKGPREWAMDLNPPGLTLSRTVKVTLANALLYAAATRGTNDGGHVLDLSADGQQVKGRHEDGRTLRTRENDPGESTEQRWMLAPFLGRRVTLTLRAVRDKDGKTDEALIWRGLALEPLVAHLPADGKILTPDVPLGDLEPVEAVWFPQGKGRRATRTQPPEPSVQKIHGLTLANSYPVRSGLKMTYRLRGGLRQFVAVVGTENQHHRGPFRVLLDGKVVWKSSKAIDRGQLEQVAVKLPRDAKTISLVPEHDMTTGAWGQAGFRR